MQFQTIDKDLGILFKLLLAIMKKSLVQKKFCEAKNYFAFLEPTLDVWSIRYYVYMKCSDLVIKCRSEPTSMFNACAK